MNSIILIGRITKDIELKRTNNGKSVVNFTLAVNRNYKNEQGEYEADFIDCVAFEGRADNIYKYVRKGHRFGVAGRLQQRSWQDKEGKNRYVYEVIVNEFEFLEPKGEESDLPYPETVGREKPKKEYKPADFEDEQMPF